MNITFLGAAGEVTGSQHLLETSERRILLDCGLFQGPRAASRRKNETLQCDPKSLDAVILSHAHIDHSGNLPQLYKQGFRGPLFCTDATADIAELMLMDAARIQAEDAKYLQRKLERDHPPVEPLYDQDDVDGLMRLCEPCSFHKWHDLAEDLRIRFLPAGHILGSAIVELDLLDEGQRKRIVFTGDLGRRGMPLLVDPCTVEGADVLITESTYGDRIHPPVQDIQAELLKIIWSAQERGGRVIIPAFSLGRTQQIVYFLNQLFNERSLPRVPIFVDSPLATKLTGIFRRYDSHLDENVQKTRETDKDIFGFDSLTYVETQVDSMSLNKRKGTFVVISASGMCESGRVVHHLKHAVSDDRNTIVLMGYQAPHTLGRQLQDQRETVRIYDRYLPLRARVVQLDGLSAHADVTDFKWWFEESTRKGHFGQSFLVHGEPESSKALASLLKDYCDEEPVIPEFGQTFTV